MKVYESRPQSNILQKKHNLIKTLRVLDNYSILKRAEQQGKKVYCFELLKID